MKRKASLLLALVLLIIVSLSAEAGTAYIGLEVHDWDNPVDFSRLDPPTFTVVQVHSINKSIVRGILADIDFVTDASTDVFNVVIPPDSRLRYIVFEYPGPEHWHTVSGCGVTEPIAMIPDESTGTALISDSYFPQTSGCTLTFELKILLSVGLWYEVRIHTYGPDRVPPEITCPDDISVEADPGQDSQIVEFPYPTVSDDQPGEIAIDKSDGPDSGSAFPVGTTTITYYAVDVAGNQSSCSFDVTVTDTESPTWTVPADITIGTDTGVSTAVVSYNATASDNAGVSSSSCSPSSGSIFALGETPVGCFAYDAAGNSAIASFMVTVVDDEAPSLSVPADITIGTDAGKSTAIVNYSPAGASDNVGVTNAGCSPSSGIIFALGETTVTCFASDAAGNITEASFKVTVVDDEAPRLTVWDYSVPTDTGVSTAVVEYVAGASDNVGVTRAGCSPSSGSIFALGVTPVGCFAVDMAGNYAIAWFTVTVYDDEAPSLSVPADMTIGTDAGKSTAVVNYSAATASDNVGVTSVSCSPSSGSTFALGTTTVNCSASDAAGNIGNASFKVTVVDDEAPTLSVPADMTVDGTSPSGAVVDYAASATDNVSVTSMSCLPASGNTFAYGKTTVNCSASDAAGNIGNASFEVTVLTPAEQSNNLISDIETLVTDGTLKTGQAKGLIRPLDNALVSLDKGHTADACNQIQDFIDEVNLKVSDGALPASNADALIADASTARAALGCG